MPQIKCELHKGDIRPSGCIPFENEKEAIQIANDSVYGLNASVWTRDVNRALRVVRDIEAGMVSVNSHGSASRYSTFSAFGGVKQSGVGRELGMEALSLYTEIKNVFIDITDGPAKMEK